jgi:hypothetical protein
MKALFKNAHLLSLLLVPLFCSPAAQARGTDIEFQGKVTKVDQTSASTGTVTVAVIGFDIPVKVTADSDVILHGDKVAFSQIKVNDFVGVLGFFAASGIVVDEIHILDDVQGAFRLLGSITAVKASSTDAVITVLGVDVVINTDTKIERRGPAGGFTIADLSVGLQVDAMGTGKSGKLVATRLKVGNRDEDAVRIGFTGTISSIKGSRLTVDTVGGGTPIVLLTDSTAVSGVLAVGKLVKVKGTFNAQLEVVADRVIVSGEEDVSDPKGTDEVKKEAALKPLSASTQLRGKVEIVYSERKAGVTQQLDIELIKGASKKEYRLLVTFGSAKAIDWGSIVTDEDGEAEVVYASSPKGKERALLPNLPAGKDIRDITKVQVAGADLTVLAEASF